MNTLSAPENIKSFLTGLNFKMNGNDFYKSFPLTDFVNEWEEEVYVSLTNEGYKIWYPDSESKNKTYKSQSGLIRYIAHNHS